MEESGVAFTDGEAGGERGGWGGGLDVAGEEGGGVVGDVVVQPGEDCAGFVGGGGEGGREVDGEGGEGGDGLAREFGGVGVGVGEVAAFEAGGGCGWCGGPGGGQFRFGGQ